MEKLPEKLSYKIFNDADCRSKVYLAQASKFYLESFDKYFEQCHIDDCIDLLYEFKSISNSFKSLSQKCNDKNKKLLVSYLFIKDKNVTRDKTRWLAVETPWFKINLLKECLSSNNFDELFAQIKKNNNKNHVKFYCQYSEIIQLINQVNKECDSTSVTDQDYKRLEIQAVAKLYNNVPNNAIKLKDEVVQQVCNFFDQPISCNNFNTIYKERIVEITDISRSLSDNNFVVLVFLLNHQSISSDVNKLELIDFLYRTEKHEDRLLLVKAGCPYGECSDDPFFLCYKAVQDKNEEKVRSFFKIGFEERRKNDGFYKLFECLMGNDSYIDILLTLLDAGFCLNEGKHVDMMSAAAIKLHVEYSCNFDKKINWSKASYCWYLHKAVHLADKNLVEFLLKNGANPVVTDNENNMPIYYAMNNDSIFDLLINGSSGFFDKQFVHKNGINLMKIFVNNACQKKIIQLINVSRGISFSLMHLLLMSIKTDKREICKAAIKKCSPLVTVVDGYKKRLFNYFFSTKQQKHDLWSMCKQYNVNAWDAIGYSYELVLQEVDGYEFFLDSMSDIDLKKHYQHYKKNINISSKSKLLSYAIQQNRDEIVLCLLKDEDCFEDGLNLLFDSAIKRNSFKKIKIILEAYKKEAAWSVTKKRLLEGLLKTHKVNLLSIINGDQEALQFWVQLIPFDMIKNNEELKKEYDVIIDQAVNIFNDKKTEQDAQAIKNAILLLAREWESARDEDLKNKIKNIDVTWVESVHNYCGRENQIVHAIKVLSEINNQLRFLTYEEKNNRSKLVAQMKTAFDYAQYDNYVQLIETTFNRPATDILQRREMFNFIITKLKNCLYEYVGIFYNDTGDIEIKDKDKFWYCSNDDEKKVFDMLDQWDIINQKIHGNKVAEIERKKYERLRKNAAIELAKKVQASFDDDVKEIKYVPHRTEQVSTDTHQEEIVVDAAQVNKESDSVDDNSSIIVGVEQVNIVAHQERVSVDGNNQIVEVVEQVNIDAHQESVRVDDNNQIVEVVNGVSTSEDFLFWGTIKDAISSCFTIIFSSLQWLNPLRLIFGWS